MIFDADTRELLGLVREFVDKEIIPKVGEIEKNDNEGLEELLDTDCAALSEGQRQMVHLGRAVVQDAPILLLDEPTRGIDIGAKYEIYRLMIELAEQGKAIMMVSSEMPELLGVCDRILVLSGGRLSGEVMAADTDQEEIMALAAKYV